MMTSNMSSINGSASTGKTNHHIPDFSIVEAEEVMRQSFGIAGTAKPLGSYIDQNFMIESTSGERYILKIANQSEAMEFVKAQADILNFLEKSDGGNKYPKSVKSPNDQDIIIVKNAKGEQFRARLLTFLNGTFMGEMQHHDEQMLESLGIFLAEMDNHMERFSNAFLVTNKSDWNLKYALDAKKHLSLIKDPQKRNLVNHFFFQFESFALPILSGQPQSIIHGDANELNILVTENKVSGIIDFGDMNFSYTINELAIALVYAMMDKDDPFDSASHVVKGYNQIKALTEEQIEILYYLIATRLCVSVCMSSYSASRDPGNEHTQISERPAWDLLEKMVATNPIYVRTLFLRACGFRVSDETNYDTLLQRRKTSLNNNLSISYGKDPLKIVKGAMQYLYDDKGNAYLDCVNNVCHLGHCHPEVVKAGQKQMAVLNTNTRFLSDHILDYAEHLASKFPDPLKVVTFVCSGSEANDLAVRMAQTYTGGTDMIVIDHAYHGTSRVDQDLSPYKFNSKGGRGQASYIHVAEMPDLYRGKFKANDPEAGEKYAEYVKEHLERIESQGKKIAGFIGESVLGCGGQIVLPDGYFEKAFEHVRNAGGVCIVDEVQVGFGRVGSHFWGFETQRAIPDIVTMGKPIGNGHPLGAVITTPEIAEAFNNGLEYFNTFGGNPVSCYIGKTVLEVIEDEQLQENAQKVGAKLLEEFKRLGEKYSLIGDVRGMGLFLGIELVKDHQTLEPAAEEADVVIEKMKERGILLSTDGPLHNVLKFKPPMVFTMANAELFVQALDEILQEIS
ncbi:aminotransferase class III-fold pyridoxal phosphate-dependent enzyme [Fulvivirgaceae bacterium BMA10]|uniref:Aminotransferase class III-fold pyridoxal phosphate-dependent enzyme n=1 Tax=Splendidivirga corallicola TaxID=3051826 RepID=A0ABT8KUK1_9BACT|nr:aminotransferase class III-fold pyridoxal phosphate-dependent enzyme [Fulvivirgaceae bacterium BMA10]